MYLDQNSYNSDPYTTDFYTRYQHKAAYDDDEDQSMVSDASSGPPPHSAAAEDNKTNKKNKRGDAKKEPKQKQTPCLDDTASSSIHHFSQVFKSNPSSISEIDRDCVPPFPSIYAAVAQF